MYHLPSFRKLFLFQSLSAGVLPADFWWFHGKAGVIGDYTFPGSVIKGMLALQIIHGPETIFPTLVGLRYPIFEGDGGFWENGEYFSYPIHAFGPSR